MTTNDMLKKIYNDLKEESTKEYSQKFLKEYKIPSINFNPGDKTLEDHYFVSGIEMEIERLVELFNNNVYYTSYKDRYFFSNDKELVDKRLLLELDEEQENDMEM